MKKTLFIALAVMFVFTACKKDEPKTLAGTNWEAQIAQTHEQDGKTYPYTRKIDLSFSSSANGVITFNSATLPDNIELGALAIPFTYIYDFDQEKGVATIMPNGEEAYFIISGKLLKMNMELQTGFSVNLDFTKK